MEPISSERWASMSETDVRETILRPFIEALGYKFNTENDIRTSRQFKYSEKYLGRQKVGRGIDVVGFCDYECIAGPFGKFIAEAKAPTVEISDRDIFQAHSYSTHPEVRANYFLICNGKRFLIFSASNTETPIMDFCYDHAESHILEVKNYLSPEALRRRSLADRFDSGMPLALGLGPSARVVSGSVIHWEHWSNLDLIKSLLVNGRQEAMEGGSVKRVSDNLIVATIDFFTPLASIGGFKSGNKTETLMFSTKDSVISKSSQSPSLFQGFNQGSESFILDTGKYNTGQSIQIPMEYTYESVTEAIGFLEDDVFVGTYSVEWTHYFSEKTRIALMRILRGAGITLPNPLLIGSSGEFRLALS